MGSVPKSKLWQTLTRDRVAPKILLTPIHEPECGYCPLVDWNSEFIDSCAWHDAAYEQHELGTLPEDYTREKVDEMFFRQCLQRAGHDMHLLIKAAEYFLAVRIAGGLFW